MGLNKLNKIYILEFKKIFKIDDSKEFWKLKF